HPCHHLRAAGDPRELPRGDRARLRVIARAPPGSRVRAARNSQHVCRASRTGHSVSMAVRTAPRILVVEDDRDARLLLADRLQREGYVVEMAGNAADAINDLEA